MSRIVIAVRIFNWMSRSFQFKCDRLCCLVVTVPGYRPRVLGLDSQSYQIFSEEVGLEGGPFSLVRINEELREREVAAPVQKTEINGRGSSRADHATALYTLKLAFKFADQRRSFSRYSSPVD
jgi:hypothetical protein